MLAELGGKLTGGVTGLREHGMVGRSKVRGMCVVGVLAALMTTSAVQAELTFVSLGDPVGGGSWFTDFTMRSDLSTFTNVGLAIIPLIGDDGTAGFEEPGWDFTIDTGHSAGGYSQWTANFLGASLTGAAFDSTYGLSWTSHFAGDDPNPGGNGQNFLMTAFVYDGASPWDTVQVAAAMWDGYDWDFRAQPGLSFEEFEMMGGLPHAAAPPAVALALVGLGMCGWVKRRYS